MGFGISLRVEDSDDFSFLALCGRPFENLGLTLELLALMQDGEGCALCLRGLKARRVSPLGLLVVLA